MLLLPVSSSSPVSERVMVLTTDYIGYPIATVPIGQLRYNRRPFGLCVVAKAHDEGILLQFMSAYEKVAKPRPVLNL